MREIDKISNKMFRRRVKGVIKPILYTNSSVKKRFLTLLESYSIKFSDYEWDIFDVMMSSRQHYVHARDVKRVSTSRELDHLYIMLSEVVFEIVRSQND